jgi:demethylspheroidene O-methyltransferase
LTRPIARRRARAVFDLVAGFVYSQVLLACVRLRLFDLLADGPRDVADLAERSALSEDAMLRLLAAAASLRLVEERDDGRFTLGVLGAPLLDNPAIAAMVEHHSALYADLRDPVALLRGNVGTTEMSRYWAYDEAHSADAQDADAAGRIGRYSTLMSDSQPVVAEQILDAYPMARHRCLLDVGGGEGNFLVAAASRAPALRLMLFDLPAVAERARGRLAAQALASRATVAAGDFLRDELPRGADVITLIRVVHDHDDPEALAILQAARRALSPGGTLLLAEPMSGMPGAEPVGDAYFGFYLLAMGRGRPRSADELTALLRAAGFEWVHALRTRMPMLTGLLVARFRSGQEPIPPM